MPETDASKYIAQGLAVMLKNAQEALKAEEWEKLRGHMRQAGEIADRLCELKTGKDRWGETVPMMP